MLASSLPCLDTNLPLDKAFAPLLAALSQTVHVSSKPPFVPIGDCSPDREHGDPSHRRPRSCTWSRLLPTFFQVF